MTRLNTQFSVEAFHYLIQRWHFLAQFSLNSICAMRSTISLEMKSPQLSKPEATTAKNQNSIDYRMEKKTWEKPGSGSETRLSQFSSGQTNQQFIQTAAKSDCKGSTGFSGIFSMAV